MGAHENLIALIIRASARDFGTYRFTDQRRLWRVYAYAQTRHSLPCSHLQNMDVDEGAGQNLDFPGESLPPCRGLWGTLHTGDDIDCNYCLLWEC